MKSKKMKVIAGLSLVAILVLLAMRGVMGSGTSGDGSTSPAPVAVEVTPVKQTTITETVTAVGTLSALRDVMVASETAGRVTGVLFRVGDYVKQGQTLATVDNELRTVAVEQATAQALAAETNAAKARKDYERAESLYGTKDISDAELEAYRLAAHSADAQHKSALAALTAAKRQLDDTRIKAPIAGFIASKRTEVGEMVAPGLEVANIVDLSKVKVKLSIPEEDVVKLRLNQAATLRLDSAPERTFQGTVYSIGKKAENPTGHTYPVEIIVENRTTDLLKAGMFARVEVRANTVTDALTIAKESLAGDDVHPIVFVAEKNIAKARPVTLGIRSGDAVQIIDGLTKGELVITFGQKKLKDGAPVLYERLDPR